MLTAERRAQLARSRSRNNVLGNQSPGVVREINFDETVTDSPKETVRKPRPKRDDSGDESRETTGNVQKSNAGEKQRRPRTQKAGRNMQMSEAEELLKRLKEL